MNKPNFRIIFNIFLILVFAIKITVAQSSKLEYIPKSYFIVYRNSAVFFFPWGGLDSFFGKSGENIILGSYFKDKKIEGFACIKTNKLKECFISSTSTANLLHLYFCFSNIYNSIETTEASHIPNIEQLIAGITLCQKIKKEDIEKNNIEKLYDIETIKDHSISKLVFRRIPKGFKIIKNLKEREKILNYIDQMAGLKFFLKDVQILPKFIFGNNILKKINFVYSNPKSCYKKETTSTKEYYCNDGRINNKFLYEHEEKSLSYLSYSYSILGYSLKKLNEDELISIYKQIKNKIKPTIVIKEKIPSRLAEIVKIAYEEDKLERELEIKKEEERKINLVKNYLIFENIDNFEITPFYKEYIPRAIIEHQYPKSGNLKLPQPFQKLLREFNLSYINKDNNITVNVRIVQYKDKEITKELIRNIGNPQKLKDFDIYNIDKVKKDDSMGYYEILEPYTASVYRIFWLSNEFYIEISSSYSDISYDQTTTNEKDYLELKNAVVKIAKRYMTKYQPTY